MQTIITIFAIIGIIAVSFIGLIFGFILYISIQTAIKAKNFRENLIKLRDKDPEKFKSLQEEEPSYEKFKNLFKPNGCCKDKKTEE